MAGVPVSITFYKNDNSGTTINNNLYSSNDSFTIPFINCIPSGKKDLDWTREDCNFIKWKTLADGSGISYYPEDILNPLDNYLTSEAHLNLYAIWGVIPDNSIHFKVGSQSDYDLADKEPNSLYFITDSGASRIYKGETLMATYNDDYIADNTENNISVNINNDTISAEIGESIMNILNDMESEWGEIPLRELYLSDFNPTEEYPLWIRNGFLLVKMWDYYYKINVSNDNYINRSGQSYSLGSDLIFISANIQSVKPDIKDGSYVNNNYILTTDLDVEPFDATAHGGGTAIK